MSCSAGRSTVATSFPRKLLRRSHTMKATRPRIASVVNDDNTTVKIKKLLLSSFFSLDTITLPSTALRLLADKVEGAEDVDGNLVMCALNHVVDSFSSLTARVVLCMVEEVL